MKKTTAALLNAIRDESNNVKAWGIFEHEDHITDENEKKNTRPKHYLYVVIAKKAAQTFLGISKPEVKTEINDDQDYNLIFKV